MAGCGPALPAVSVQPHGTGPSLRQTFDRGFVSRKSDFGEDQVVLVNAPLDRLTPDQPAKLIRPIEGAPLHTVMSIRLHWRAVTGSLTTDAGQNAVLHWYVYGSPAGGPPSLVHYVGTGFVTLADSGDGATVAVSHATLAVKERYGDLRDPLGTFAVAGTFHAVTSDAQVAETLADVSSALAAAVAAHPAAATHP